MKIMTMNKQMLGLMTIILALTFWGCKTNKYTEHTETQKKKETNNNKEVNTDKNTITDVTIFEFDDKDTCECECDSDTVNADDKKENKKPKLKKITKIKQRNNDKIQEKENNNHIEQVQENKDVMEENKNSLSNYWNVFLIGLIIGILIPITFRLLLLYFFHR